MKWGETVGNDPDRIDSEACPECGHAILDDKWEEVEAYRYTDVEGIEEIRKGDWYEVTKVKEYISGLHSSTLKKCPECSTIFELPSGIEAWECSNCHSTYEQRNDANNCCH